MSELNLTHSNGNKVKLTTPDTLAANKTFKLPGADGSSGQFLKTDGSGALSFTSQLTGSRRLNINGSFLVWQRATSIAVSDGSNEGFQAADRMLFKFGGGSGGAATISRSTDVPTRSGFVYSYKIDVTTANSLSTNDHVQNEYIFEGQDILSSGWDYKDPNSYLTISLYLKTNKSGNPKLPLTLRLNDSAGNYRYYTEDITIVGTGWGRYSISIPGDASANDIANNTTDGCTLFICWSTGSGLVGTTGAWRSDGDRASSSSANFFDSTSNEMYMTGLQFEVGNTMTSYEHRTYGDELFRCQRYFQYVEYAQAMARTSTNTGAVSARFSVPMRSSPSISTLNLSTFATNVGLNLQGDGSTNSTQSSGNQGTNYSSSRTMYLYDISGFSGMSAGRTYVCGVPANNAVVFTASAEI